MTPSFSSVAFQIMWRTSELIIWHTGDRASLSSGLPDDQVFSRRFQQDPPTRSRAR